jgi:hypothetical protein
VRGDGVLMADLAGAIATADGAHLVFSTMGLGRKNENGRSFDAVLAMTVESDDERYAWASEALCIVQAVVVGRKVTMKVHRVLAD